jgi:hypothetical protein
MTQPTPRVTLKRYTLAHYKYFHYFPEDVIGEDLINCFGQKCHRTYMIT